MNFDPRTTAGPGARIWRLAVAVLVLALSSGLASATVLASSATDQYTEPPIPTVPGKKPGKTKPGETNRAGGGNGSDTSGGTTSKRRVMPGPGAGDSKESGGVHRGVGNGEDRRAEGGADEISSPGSENSGNDEASAVISAFGGSGGGGLGGGGLISAVIALLVGVPVLAGLTYSLYRYRQRHSDAETRDHLRDILNGDDSSSPGTP